ncbi:putative signal recognition particle receptor subunit beta [Rhypophila decipiens]|uniref:Signal recognition particle receptor subunit beta n=1 Tax=Rhypophila decipiens TaxID=261697 RepID=A0AAN6Y1W6_9PEZI|nr:putative signal recognition particle receptor subunit beta [Rhypophila decipiens]
MGSMKMLMSLIEASLQPTPTVFTIGIIIVFLFPFLLHYLVTRSTSYSTLPAVLLLGPSGSGKTALTTLFERGPYLSSSESEKPSLQDAVPATHTSQTPQTIELSISTDDTSTTSYKTDLDALGAPHKKFLLIDTPGHAKLRNAALSRLIDSKYSLNPSTTSKSTTTDNNKLKAVIFLVDAAGLSEDTSGSDTSLASTASYLYDALLTLQKRATSAKGSKAPPSIPVLIAANKLDLFTALPAALVKSNLEAELGRIRAARSKGLLDSGVGVDDDLAGGGGDEESEWLGEYGSEKFSFKQLMEFDIEVDVIGGNIVGDGPGADKWWRWIAEKI